MPVPRRQLHLLVQDAAGTTPIVTPRIARLERYAHETRRCAAPHCRCVLARDNTEPYCSPCQRRRNRMPQRIGDYLEQHPQHEHSNGGPRNRGPSQS